MKRLDAAGIATRQGTHAAAFVDYYRTKYEIDRDRYPNAWIADRLSFALPLYPGMTDEEQTFVCRTVVEVGEAVLV